MNTPLVSEKRTGLGSIPWGERIIGKLGVLVDGESLSVLGGDRQGAEIDFEVEADPLVSWLCYETKGPRGLHLHLECLASIFDLSEILDEAPTVFVGLGH